MTSSLHALVASIRHAAESQIFAGGLALGIFGTVVATLRRVPGQLADLVRRQIIVSVDVPQSTDAFDWLSVWLDGHPYTQKSRRLTVATRSGGGLQDSKPGPSGPARADDGPAVMYTPAPGHHVLWYQGRPLWLHRERKEVSGRDGYGGYQETYTLRMLGRSAAAFRALFVEARALASTEERRVSIYAARWDHWARLAQTRPRALASVVLAAGVAERLLEDARRFLASEAWYRDRGIPWRRGYLLEGPPGTGKSSTIAALAGELGLNLHVLNVADRGMTDDRLASLLLDASAPSILLLEDIDAVVHGRTVEGGPGGVTFAGLLNALDGVASQQGVLTFLTTNHPEVLDPALLRNGRVDVRLHLGPATAEQAERFFLHFYAGSDRRDLPALARRFGAWGEGKTVADLQGVLLGHREDPAGALEDIRVPGLRLAAVGA